MAIKTFLTPDNITKMIDTADNLRDKVIITFLSDCGVRVSELLAVTRADLDLDRLEVSIPHLKRGIKKHCPKCGNTAGRTTKFCARCGTDLRKIEPEGEENRKRLISIGQDCANLLQEYVTRMDQIKPMTKDTRLIPLTRQMVWHTVHNVADAAGLGGKIILNPATNKNHYVHPHDFRAALATSWLEYAAGDANKQKALQETLGHKSFETTLLYNRLTASAVRKTGDEVRKARFGTRKGGAT
jgi:integrase